MEWLSDTPVLRTDRLLLRAPCEADFEAWATFAADDRARYIGGPLDRGRAWRAFASLIGHWLIRGCGPFVFTREGAEQPLGSTGPWFPADWPEREIGWTIWSPEAEGRGFAREAASAVLRHVYRDLGWRTAVSYIDPSNARSIALAERLGAAPDPDAATPANGEALVYRHPAPEVA